MSKRNAERLSLTRHEVMNSSERVRIRLPMIFSCFIVLLSFNLSGCTSNIFGHEEPYERPSRYGAIAYSYTSQHWHIRRNVNAASRAAALAMQNCGASDCRVILQFGPGECGTFSLGDGGAVGVGTGLTEKSAYDAAFAQCRASGQNCKVAPVQCNS